MRIVFFLCGEFNCPEWTVKLLAVFFEDTSNGNYVKRSGAIFSGMRKEGNPSNVRRLFFFGYDWRPRGAVRTYWRKVFNVRCALEIDGFFGWYWHAIQSGVETPQSKDAKRF
jgi:hypothetical protein